MTLKVVLFAVLLALTAFFVATEFAIVKLRTSRVNQMVLEGAKNAKAVQTVTTHLDSYLSACQLGITITALGLGWLGEPTIAKMLDPLFAFWNINPEISSVLTFVIAFSIVTYLHVVLGELAPKTLAIIMSEKISQWTAPYIIFFYKLMYPFIWLLNGSANWLVRIMGFKQQADQDAHSEEEIRMIVSESYESGKINQREYGYVNRIFAFDERLAKEIMIPRTDMVCLYVDAPLDEHLAIIRQERYTRFPIAKGSKDHIIGILHTKHLFLHDPDQEDYPLDDLLSPVLSVPETIPISKLLSRMQNERSQLAILLDEYGGTSGMITVEDIVEEIVGEIRDEFDEDEEAEIEQVAENVYRVSGRTLIEDLNDQFHLNIDAGEVDTIGGWIFENNANLAAGEQWQFDSYSLTVRERDDYRIRMIDITLIDQPTELEY
ncbi:hemolysin family protein [Paenibacillus yanchengensis]|uniref:Hemolysin family protein n=1 Tax=Paenibacillus yanchengensis TaxID=2035833 RepID=A0ABW4YLX3_9BACL